MVEIYVQNRRLEFCKLGYLLPVNSKTQKILIDMIKSRSNHMKNLQSVIMALKTHSGFTCLEFEKENFPIP
jgi:hypothetical protein